MPVTVFTIAKVAALCVAALVSAATTALPWWFKMTVQVSRDGGTTMEDLTLDVGIFFMDQGAILQTDLIFVDKATNAHVVPDFYKMGQLFYGLGSMGLLVCAGASLVYMFRTNRSATGDMCMAGSVFPCAISLVLGVLFAIMGTIGDISWNDNNVWKQFPIPNYYVEPYLHPKFEMNFILYAAAVAAISAIVASALFWMHACSSCQEVEKIRQQMLYAPLTDDERGVGPETTYRFEKPNPGFRYDGYSKPSTAQPYPTQPQQYPPSGVSI